MESKKCTKCNETKLVSEFAVRKDTKSGYRAQCKQCVSDWHANHYTDNKKMFQERSKAYYLDNSEAIMEKTLEYKRNNKEAVALKNHNWYLKNKGKCLAKSAARRALEFKAMTPTTCLKTIEAIIIRRPEGYHVDHIVPLSKGGTHHQDNLCYLPAEFNLSKGAKLLSEHPELNEQFNELAIFPTV